ncbi:MAG TPA: cyclic nucleotide-binding domain-containing protein, partial [Polyangiaceae bacterium]|nr:cyclic nucleotide-binding domain-containing protein [Polyangiaceae bacterium]
MDTVQARGIMTDFLRDSFGRVLQLRDVAIVRKASGRTWRGEVVCAVADEEIPVGHLIVHEDGRLIETCSIDDLVEAIRSVQRHAGPASAVDLFSDFDEPAPTSGPMVSFGIEEDIEHAIVGIDEGMPLRDRIKQLKSAGRREDLLLVRDLLPQLLVETETRRFTLVEMGEIELRLGNSDLSLQYLEAAAKEFADRAEVKALELVASIAHRVLGEESFAANPVKQLLDLSRRRLRPIDHLGQSAVFAGLGQDEVDAIRGVATELTVEQGKILLQEGAEAVQAYVVRSGILSIRLQTAEGGACVVRCCFPGDFVGETSVLGEPGATCSATVRAECLTSVWGFRGSDLRLLGTKMPVLLTRLESSRALDRLDSFLSMHETTQTLDTRMRDRILSCVIGVRRSQANELLNTPGEIPSVVYLVAEGSVEYAAEDAPTRCF